LEQPKDLQKVRGWKGPQRGPPGPVGRSRNERFEEPLLAFGNTLENEGAEQRRLHALKLLSNLYLPRKWFRCRRPRMKSILRATKPGFQVGGVPR
jgi:hypothetical protein